MTPVRRENYLPELAGADAFARHDELDAPVLLTAGRRAVGSDGLRLTESNRGDRSRDDALLDEIGAYRFPASLGESLVGIVAADVVGMPLDLETESLM